LLPTWRFASQILPNSFISFFFRHKNNTILELQFFPSRSRWLRQEGWPSDLHVSPVLEGYQHKASRSNLTPPSLPFNSSVRADRSYYFEACLVRSFKGTGRVNPFSLFFFCSRCQDVFSRLDLSPPPDFFPLSKTRVLFNPSPLPPLNLRTLSYRSYLFPFTSLFLVGIQEESVKAPSLCPGSPDILRRLSSLFPLFRLPAVTNEHSFFLSSSKSACLFDPFLLGSNRRVIIRLFCVLTRSPENASLREMSTP